MEDVKATLAGLEKTNCLADIDLSVRSLDEKMIQNLLERAVGLGLTSQRLKGQNSGDCLVGCSMKDIYI
jgi:hypothetical protein